ncbi:FtsB family cell division protein [Intrasporangium sp.]|uniref:FtsB family cell division protein n=1 Tax=Intrasporangium sp. TaxID=1925024 RepID=UPI00293A4A93|nr:septum formation initiator family protein [Intrasporangium sp.]MDV3223280.1 septum formation initiator family protein [Intrasporangium sp.]
MRGAILLGIIVMLAVTLVPTLRSVIQQRNDTVALQGKVAQQHLTVEELEKQAALWEDPTYIEEQARERLRFVRVGDRAYSVTGIEAERSEEQAAQDPLVAAPMANESSPWYGKVWQSIQIADRPTAGLAR